MRRSLWLVVAVLVFVPGVPGTGPGAGRLGAVDSGPGSFDVANIAKLRAAVLALNGNRSGGLIRLKPGVYELDADKEGVVAPLRLQGSNSVTIVGGGWNTTIRRSDAGNVFEFQDSHSCAIRDLLVAYRRPAGALPAASGSGLVFIDSLGNTVDHCRIQMFTDSGIRFEGVSRSLSGNRVQNCQLIGNHGDQLYGFRNNDFFISGNEIGAGGRANGVYTDTARNGTRLDASSAGTYTMNYHWANDVAFRLNPGSNYNRIENNRFEESATNGIVIGDPAATKAWTLHNTFTGNTIHTNSQSVRGAYAAVLAYDAQFVVFTGNQAFSWDPDHYVHKASLELARDCWHWTVRDNVFRHNVVGPVVIGTLVGHILGRDPANVDHPFDASNVVF